MTDIWSKQKRSEVMSRIRSTNTSPELIIRSELHKAGFRFRIHRSDLPGKPDLVFPKYRTIVFVHGCFWHQHRCLGGRVPKSRTGYWLLKFGRNKKRDKQVKAKLRSMGWKVLVVWECQIRKNLPGTVKKLTAALLQGKTG